MWPPQTGARMHRFSSNGAQPSQYPSDTCSKSIVRQSWSQHKIGLLCVDAHKNRGISCIALREMEDANAPKTKGNFNFSF